MIPKSKICLTKTSDFFCAFAVLHRILCAECVFVKILKLSHTCTLSQWSTASSFTLFCSLRACLSKCPRTCMLKARFVYCSASSSLHCSIVLHFLSLWSAKCPLTFQICAGALTACPCCLLRPSNHSCKTTWMLPRMRWNCFKINLTFLQLFGICCSRERRLELPSQLQIYQICRLCRRAFRIVVILRIHD